MGNFSRIVPNRTGMMLPTGWESSSQPLGLLFPTVGKQQSLMLSALTMPRLQYLQICAAPSTYLAEEQEIPAPLTWNRDWLPVPECPHPFGGGGHEGDKSVILYLKN